MCVNYNIKIVVVLIILFVTIFLLFSMDGFLRFGRLSHIKDILKQIKAFDDHLGKVPFNLLN